jgi:hypothetical protein
MQRAVRERMVAGLSTRNYRRAFGYGPNGRSNLEARISRFAATSSYIPQPGNPNVVIHFYDSAC